MTFGSNFLRISNIHSSFKNTQYWEFAEKQRYPISYFWCDFFYFRLNFEEFFVCFLVVCLRDYWLDCSPAIKSFFRSHQNGKSAKKQICFFTLDDPGWKYFFFWDFHFLGISKLLSRRLRLDCGRPVLNRNPAIQEMNRGAGKSHFMHGYSRFHFQCKFFKL